MKKIQHNHMAFLLMLIGGGIVGIGPILAKVINMPATCIVLYRIMLPIPILFFIRKVNNISSEKKCNAKYLEQDKASTTNNKVHISNHNGDHIIQKKTFLYTPHLLMLAIGILFSLDLITFYIALKFTTVASATLLSNLSPILIITYTVIKNKKISRDIIWPILACIGLLLLCNITHNFSTQQIWGDLIAFISAIFFTGYIVLVNKLGSRYNSIDIMLWSSIGGAIFVTSLCLLFGISLHIMTRHDLILLLIMSWGTQLVGQTILTAGISRFPPTLSSLGILIDPVAAATFAWLLLGESLNATEMLGATIVLVSMFCAYRLNDKLNNKGIINE